MIPLATDAAFLTPESTFLQLINPACMLFQKLRGKGEKEIKSFTD